MTTKTAGRKQGAAPTIPEDVQAAYQAHTLAQILYGQITAAYPFAMPTAPVTPFYPVVGMPRATWTEQSPWTQQPPWTPQSSWTSQPSWTSQQPPTWPTTWAFYPMGHTW